MVEALKVLGVQLTEDWANSRLVVQGCGGRFPSEPLLLRLLRPAAAAPGYSLWWWCCCWNVLPAPTVATPGAARPFAVPPLPSSSAPPRSLTVRVCSSQSKLTKPCFAGVTMQLRARTCSWAMLARPCAR